MLIVLGVEQLNAGATVPKLCRYTEMVSALPARPAAVAAASIPVFTVVKQAEILVVVVVVFTVNDVPTADTDVISAH